ncbi:MAG TPA: RluA family pseudouridine synthase [Thermoanaerobaculia bacterium]|nr:RluA family pseudouridine synthase [Thermoanaerobaculia bacterium]
MEAENLKPAIRVFGADRGDARRRLDRVLVRHLADLPGASRSRLQGWIAAGRVRVNGMAAVRPARCLAAGDRVEIALAGLSREPRPRPAPEEIALSVLYEDEHLLAVDKPAGMVVHPAPGHRAGTLINALLWRAQSWGAEAARPGLVNRLDRGTSGVVLVAKSGAAHSGLARALRRRAIEKDYLALVYGTTPLCKGRIALKVARDGADRRRMTASRIEGRDAVTLYERLCEGGGRRPARERNPGARSAERDQGAEQGAAGRRETALSLLRCRLVTGRTHQIRVHLRAAALPLVGDPLYGAPRYKGLADPALAAACRDFPRQALHAHRLALRHPVSGAPLELLAPVPDDLLVLFRAAGLCSRLA